MSVDLSGGLRPSPDWALGYPGATAGLLAMDRICQPASSPALLAEKARVEEELRLSFPDRAALKAHPLARAYNAYYKRFGWSYTVLPQVESVAVKGKTIPALVPLVTAMFTAELKTLLLTAGHDLATLEGPVRLLVARGGERFVRLSGEEQEIKKGDLHMADERGIIAAVLHGPDQRTRLTAASTGVLYCVYGVPGVPREAMAAHLDLLESYVRLVDPAARTLLKAAYQA